MTDVELHRAMAAALRRAAKTDWSELTNRLRARSGRALASFHEAVGVDERTLNRLARGEVHQPRFLAGVRLLQVCERYFSERDWAAVCGEIHGAGRPAVTGHAAVTQH